MFEKMFKLVQEVEETECCPVFAFGIFFNSGVWYGNPLLDVEGRTGAEFLYCDEDLERFLQKEGVEVERFKQFFEL